MMNATVDHHPDRAEALLREARQWSAEIDGLRESRALLTHRGVLWVLGLCATVLLGIGLLSVGPAGEAGRPPMSVVWLMWLGGAGSLALFLAVWRLRVLPRSMLSTLLLALCLMDIASAALNGLPALIFVPGLIVTLHVLLDHRAALRLGALTAASGLGIVIGLHPATPLAALVRLGTAILGVLIVMQLVARYWWLFTESTHRLGRELGELIQQLDTEIADTLAEKEQLRRTDPDTGFLNRMGFEEQVLAWVERGHPRARLAVLRLCQWEASMAPLPASQQLALCEQLARILRQTLDTEVEPNVVVGRTGLGEFCLLLPEEPSPERSDLLLEKLLERLLPPVTMTTATALTQPRLGFARWPQDGDSVAQLTARARWALEASIMGRRPEVRGFEPEMERLGAERLMLASEFGRALALGQLELMHHPCARPDGQLAARTEGLLGWNHPDRGRLVASDLLGGLKGTEQVDAIMDWLLRQAAGQVRSWRNDLSPDFEVAFEMPIDWALRVADHPKALRELARGLAWPTHAIARKVAEDALLRDPPKAARALDLLRSLGLKIAIDRFGVGLSGFAHLRRLPASRLQIESHLFDRIESDPRRAAICAAVVQIGHAMGLEVMADGVQTSQQREALARLGCDGLQGALLGPAMSASEFETRWRATAAQPPART